MGAPTSLSNNIDERGRRKTRQVRIYSILGAVVTCLAVILIGLLVLMLVLQQQDQTWDRVCAAEEAAVAEYWAGVCRNAVISTVSAAYCVTGFVLGRMTRLPPLNGTPAERVAGQSFENFPLLAEMLNFSDHNLGLIATVPGGVVDQTVPNVPGLDMYDLLYNYTPPLLGTTDPWERIHNGLTAILGPRKRHVAGMTGGIRWDIDVMQPVHNTSNNLDRSERNFWGFSYTILSLTSLLEEQQLVDYFDKERLDFLMYYIDANGTIVPVFSSVPDLRTQEQLLSLISQGTSHSILSSKLDWLIAVHRNRGPRRLSQRNIAIILGTIISGSVTLLLVAIGIIVCCTQEYDGRRHAPKQAPFAIVTIGPVHGDELWHLASDQMVEVSEKLDALLARAMAAHHGYPTVQLHPLTSSYVTRSVGAAVRMSFYVLEELQSRPIDASLRRLLGDDGRLLLSCAVHWCTDATVIAEPGGGGYRFEGPDVLLGGRMWFFAAPNTVTLSGAANDARLGDELHGTTVEPFNSVYLRGVKLRQSLFITTDPSSRRLREAIAIANARLQRMRDIQQRHQQDTLKPFPSDGAEERRHDVITGNSSFGGAPDFLHSPRTSSFSSTTNTPGGGAQEMSLSQTTSATSLVEMEAAVGRVMLRRPSASTAARAHSLNQHLSHSQSHHPANPLLLLLPGSTTSRLPTPSPQFLAPSSASSSSGGGGGSRGGGGTADGEEGASASATAVAVAAAAAAEDGHPLAYPTDGPVASGYATTMGGSRPTGRSSRPAPPWVAGASSAPASTSAECRAGAGAIDPHPHGAELRVGSMDGCLRGARYKPDSPLAVEGSASHGAGAGTAGPSGSACMAAAAAADASGGGASSTSSSSVIVDGSLTDGGISGMPSHSHLRLTRFLGNRGGDRKATFNNPLLVEVPAGRNPLLPHRADPAQSFSRGSASGGGEVTQSAAVSASGGSTSVYDSSVGNGRRAINGASLTPANLIGASLALGLEKVSLPSLFGTVFGEGPLGAGASATSRLTASASGVLFGNPAGSRSSQSVLYRVRGASGSGSQLGCDSGSGVGGASISGLVDSNSISRIVGTAGATDGVPCGPVNDPEVIQRALLHPSYPMWLDTALRSAYEHQAVGSDISYDSVRVLIYYFFSSLKLLFRPLSAQERMSIYKRLMAAFGVPQQGVLEHLAARCVTQFMQQHGEAKALLLEPHACGDAAEKKHRREKKKSA